MMPSHVNKPTRMPESMNIMNYRIVNFNEQDPVLHTSSHNGDVSSKSRRENFYAFSDDLNS